MYLSVGKRTKSAGNQQQISPIYIYTVLEIEKRSAGIHLTPPPPFI